jgi:hypothetical protein
MSALLFPLSDCQTLRAAQWAEKSGGGRRDIRRGRCIGLVGAACIACIAARAIDRRRGRNAGCQLPPDRG